MARIDGLPALALAPLAQERSRAEQFARVWPALLAMLALAHGLLYLAIVPPWQHYDEPTHFEYARLIALWDRRPAQGESDLATQREIADSMYRFGFWPAGVRPALFGSQPPNIGFDEKVHPPLYYALAAVPVRWLRAYPVELQLYAARLVSVALYLLVVLCAWRIAQILAPERPLIQVAIPLSLMFVPAFADQMSAVNNDTLVNFGTTALLLGCVLLIRGGLRPAAASLALLGLVVAIFSKRTAVVGALPLGLALVWSLHMRPLRWWIWLVGAIILTLAAGFLAFDFSSGQLAVRPWLVDLDRQYLRLSLDQLTAALPGAGGGQRNYALLFDVLFSSFWMHFGWGNIQMAPAWIWLVRIGVLACGIGLILAGVRPRALPALWQRRVIWLFVVTVLLGWLAAIVRFEAQQSNYVPRGRYVHLVIAPMIWLLALGLERLAPPRWSVYCLAGMAGFFGVLDTFAWAGTLLPFFYN